MIAETCKTEVGGVLFHALDEVGERAEGLRCPSDFGHPHETRQRQVLQMVCIGDVFRPERGLDADVVGVELCGHIVGNGQVIIHLLQVVSATSGAEVLAACTAVDVVATILSPVADDGGQPRLGGLTGPVLTGVPAEDRGPGTAYELHVCAARSDGFVPNTDALAQ